MSFGMMIIMTSFPDTVHGMIECSVCKDYPIDVPTFPIGSISYFLSCSLFCIFGEYVWTLGHSTSQGCFQKTYNSSLEGPHQCESGYKNFILCHPVFVEIFGIFWAYCA